MVSVLFIIGAFLIFKNRINWEINKNNFEAQRVHQKEIDLEMINHADQADPAAVYGASIRLSIKPTDHVRKKMIELIKSKNSQVRAGAAFFLVNQNDPESLAAVKIILKDPDVVVRENIARGFNYNPIPERAAIIREFLASGALTDSERIHAFSALHRSVPTQDEKGVILKQLIEFATQEKNPYLSQLSILELCNLAPQNEKVLDLLRKSVQKKVKAITAVAIKTLAVKRDPWITENVEKLAFDSDLDVRHAIVESLHFLCPINRWTIIEKGFRDEKQLALKKEIWLSEAEKMPGTQASEFYNRLIKSYKEDRMSEELAAVHASFNSMKKSSFKDPCQEAR